MGSEVVEPGLSCSAACEIFPDQELNWCPLIGRWILNNWTTRELLGILFGPDCCSLSTGPFSKPSSVSQAQRPLRVDPYSIPPRLERGNALPPSLQRPSQQPVLPSTGVKLG